MDHRYVDDKGYVRIWMPTHPHNNAGYVLEHRLVMEQYVGRIIEPLEVVHHINEVKTDNRIGNLYLCTQEEHVRIHNRGARRSAERRNQIRKGVREHRRKERKS